MRRYFSITFLLIFGLAAAQSSRLAENYMEEGEYEKALNIYNTMLKRNAGNLNLVIATIDIHHELEQYDRVDSLLDVAERRTRSKGQIAVERGYNLSLQNKADAAQRYYDEAIALIDSNPNLTYSTAYQFSKRGLLDQAITVYKKGMAQNERFNFEPQLARLYGEKGELDKMFETYLDLIVKNEAYRVRSQALFSRYITDNPQADANQKLRKVLLLRSRESQNPIFNELLSWLYIQQNQFDRALIQEKAIYLRERRDLNGIYQLAMSAKQKGASAAAINAFDYIIEESQIPSMTYSAHSEKLDVMADVATTDEKLQEIKNTYLQLLEDYGRSANTYKLQYAFARFLSFKLDENEEALAVLETLLDQKLNRFNKARTSMLKADILVKQEFFNQALLIYSRIQQDLPNDELAQQAQFKVARTSYFQGDFDWAVTQLNVLGSATSKLIANDAIELKILIKDNIKEDSLGVALSAFAKADFNTYQQNDLQAIKQLEEVLKTHGTTSVADEALLLLGKLHAEAGRDETALRYFEQLLTEFPEEITVDDALYHAALLHQQTGNTDRALELLEKFIFNHADSIYFVDARKTYRLMRGDINTKAF